MPEAMRHVNQSVVRTAQREVHHALLRRDRSRQRLLRYINAGHNYPLLRRADGSVEELREGGRRWASSRTRTTNRGRFRPPGDGLMLYSDGISEAIDHGGRSSARSGCDSVAPRDAPPADVIARHARGRLVPRRRGPERRHHAGRRRFAPALSRGRRSGGEALALHRGRAPAVGAVRRPRSRDPPGAPAICDVAPCHARPRGAPRSCAQREAAAARAGHARSGRPATGCPTSASRRCCAAPCSWPRTTRSTQHGGLDWSEIHASTRRNLKKRRSPRREHHHAAAREEPLPRRRATLTRKLTEVFVAMRLERALSKRRIFELYLNLIEWGDGVFGVEAAARRYFGVSAAALDARQAVLLAAVIINPRRYRRSTRRADRAPRAHDARACGGAARWTETELLQTSAASTNRPGDCRRRAAGLHGAPPGHSPGAPLSPPATPSPGARPPPSARPFTCAITTPITLPMSFGPAAPVFATASRTSARNSSSESTCGR